MQISLEGGAPFHILPLNSFMIDLFGYDVGNRTLVLRFRRQKGLYCYHDVPPSVWQDFQNATSKGTFFARYLKPNYPKFDRVFDYKIIKMAASLPVNAGVCEAVKLLDASVAADCWL